MCIHIFTVKVRAVTSYREHAKGVESAFLLLSSVSKEVFKLFLVGTEDPLR